MDERFGRWWWSFAAHGRAGLKSKARGPAPGHGSQLAEEQEAKVQVLIRKQMPDELGLPFALWSRAAVQALVRQRFGVTVAVRTMGSYLARWGYTPQKPLRRAYEQDPAAVRRWLRREYPAIAARAKAEKGVIFWGDESGLRSDDVRGRSYAPRGKTPVVRPNHRRANIGLVSAVTNRGEVRWMVLDGAIKAPTLIRFLARLVRDAGRMVFLILDRLQVHRAGLVRTWLSERGDQIEVFYLPAYSPDLNPDEGLNGDLKQAVTARPLARSKGQLKQAVVNHMRSLSKRPERIRSFFRHPQFRYAA
jgi:transposase